MAKAKAKASAAASPRSRNLGLRRVKVADIADNPRNFRTHGKFQQDSFAGVVDEIGWYGYPDVFQAPDGRLMLVDGELRKRHLIARYGANAEVEVNVTDFTPTEADIALATKDPIAALAGTEGEKLAALVEAITPNSAELSALIDSLKDQAFEATVGAMAAAPAPTSEGVETDPDVLGRSHRTVSATLTDEQWAIVDKAIREAKQRGRLDTTAAALASICKEWLAAGKAAGKKQAKKR